MVTLALVLLVLVVLLIIAVIAGSGESVTLDVFGVEVGTTVVGLFLTGLVAGVITILAVALLRIGLRKGMRQRQRMRELERRARDAEATRPAGATAVETETRSHSAEPTAMADDEPMPGGAGAPENSETP